MRATRAGTHGAGDAHAAGEAGLDQLVDDLEVAECDVGRALGHRRQHLVLAVELDEPDAGVARAQLRDQEVLAQQRDLAQPDVLRLGDQRAIVVAGHERGRHADERPDEVVVGTPLRCPRHADDHVEPAGHTFGVDLREARTQFLLDVEAGLACREFQHVGAEAAKLAQRPALRDRREACVVAHADAAVRLHPGAFGEVQLRVRRGQSQSG